MFVTNTYITYNLNLIKQSVNVKKQIKKTNYWETNVKNTKNIDVADLNKKLGERGFQIANGYGKLKDKTFRIAHMADCTLADIKELLKNIDEILGF